MSRRHLITAGAAATAMASWPGGRLLAREPAPSVSDPVMLTGFDITGRQEKDVSEAFQAAIDAAGRNGGGVVRCPPGVIWAKKLVVPNNVTIEGAGVGATTIKLPDGADTDLIQQSSYAENKPFANLYFGLRDLTLDGNKGKNARGNLAVMRGYRGLIERVRFHRSAEHGILYSEKSQDGVPNVNGLAANSVRASLFDDCSRSGIFAASSGGNRIADMFIVDCEFNGNGRNGGYQIDLERSAGFHIKGNQMYRGGLGDVRALQAGALIVSHNHFDGTENEPTGATVRQVYVEAGGWGNMIISNNLFHTHRTTSNGVEAWNQLEIVSQAATGIIVSGNSFFSQWNRDTNSIVTRGDGARHIAVSGNGYGGTAREPSRIAPRR